MRIRTTLAALLLLVAFAPGAAADPAAPAAREAAAPSAADLAFLASLDEAPPALPDLGTPAPLSLACSVSNDCGDGNVAYCEGNSTCTTTIAGVKCDGTEVRCPNFCTISQQCHCCDGIRTQTCWSKKGDCQDAGTGIACDGRVMPCRCPFCQ
ncbi:MAG TPA: hypothetical protein VF100_05845 [Thermoanaerobaculia bacterium]